MSFVCVDFLKFLEKNFQDKPVAVEFECGGCCKKAIGVLTCITPSFIRLESEDDEEVPFVRITTLCPSMNCPVEECAKEIIIKECSIIAIERRPFFGQCEETTETETTDTEDSSESDDSSDSENSSESDDNSDSEDSSKSDDSSDSEDTGDSEWE